MASRPRPDPLAVERKVHFYRVDAGNDAAGQPIPYDPTDALLLISAFDYQDLDDTGPYLNNEEGNALCCWTDSASSPHRLRYVRVRRTGLPRLLQRGALGPLGIPADSGLAEEIHVRFFDNNIVGSEFNFYGPRLSSLGYYLDDKAPGTGPKVRFEPLINMDTARTLSRLNDVSVLKLRIRPSFVTVIQSLNPDLGASFEAAHRAGESEEVELILRPARYSRSKLKDDILQFARGLASVSNLREEVSQFEVKGFDEVFRANNAVDVLSDRLVASKRMVKQDERSRAVTSASAYAAIDEAYTDLRDELLEAASLRV